MVPNQNQKPLPRTHKLQDRNRWIYQKAQNHLKLFQHKTDKKDKNDTWTIKYESKMSRGNNNTQIRPKHKIKPLVKLNL